jgi:hypothetical protein
MSDGAARPWPHAAERVEALIVSGGETDVCVLSAILGAVDYGYRVVLARDALCSSSDETHDAVVALFETRYREQVEGAQTETISRTGGQEAERLSDGRPEASSWTAPYGRRRPCLSGSAAAAQRPNGGLEPVDRRQCARPC